MRNAKRLASKEAGLFYSMAIVGNFILRMVNPRLHSISYAVL
jgi:hypothetical protein